MCASWQVSNSCHRQRYTGKWATGHSNQKAVFCPAPWPLTLTSGQCLAFSEHRAPPEGCLKSLSLNWGIVALRVVLVSALQQSDSVMYVYVGVSCSVMCDSLWPHRLFPAWLPVGLPGDSDGKECACNIGDLGSILGLGRSLGEGNGNPLQYSCLESANGQSGLAGSMGSQRVRHDWTTKPRLLCPWDSPEKTPGVGCHAPLQGIFPTQRLNPSLLHCRQILYWLSHLGSLIQLYIHMYPFLFGFHGGSVLKNLPVHAGNSGDMSLILGLGRSPGGGIGNPLQCSWQISPMDRGAWWAMVYVVVKSQIPLSDWACTFLLLGISVPFRSQQSIE